MDREKNEVKIGKVRLDYQYHKPDLHYSDGDIENILLDAAQKGKLHELLSSSNEWAVLYHCSNIRENLLEWYPFKKESSLLEIGSGCGALTGLFSRKVESVTCIELSERRSMINAYRNQECDNIRILLGNFEDIQINDKFDYITLIGVWEYAGEYLNSEVPYVDMLRKVKKYLKPDGKLLIAIENKMGIKYWNGAPEDHTGKMYSGLNDYVGEKKVRTFSRPEIECLLEEAGLNSFKFYYPMPDYKLPEVIYSDKRLPQPGELRDYKKNYNGTRVYNFYDAVVCDQLCSDKMISYFANSFLVECGDLLSDVIYAKYNRTRKKEYAISTVIVQNDDLCYVEKKALTEEAEKHIKHISQCAISPFRGMQFLKGDFYEGNYRISYIEGIDLCSMFYQYRNNVGLFISQVQKVVQMYLKPKDFELTAFRMTKEYMDIFGEEYAENARCLCPANIDLIFSNIRITVDGSAYCIDNEWMLDFPVPYEYILWRAVTQLYSQYMVYLKKQISKNDFLLAVGMKKDNLEIYQKMEINLRSKVYDVDYRDRYKKPVLMYDFRFL